MANIISKYIENRKMIRMINEHFADFQDLIENKEYDIAHNKKVLDAYIANKNFNFYLIKQLLDAGVDINQIATYPKCVDLITDEFIRIINEGDVFSYNYRANIFDNIIKEENIDNIISRLNINGEVFDNNILKEWKYPEVYKIIDIARKSGYMPFKNGIDINILFDEDSKVKQESFLELGLINADIYNQMYKYKLNKYLEWINNGLVGPAPSIDIIGAEFDNIDDPAKYWINQSKMLGMDAIDVVMKYIANNMQIDDINGLFDSNYIPTDKFFKTDKVGYPLRVTSGNTEKFKNSSKKSLEMLYFLCNNVEKYDGAYRKFFELLNQYKEGKNESDIKIFLVFLDRFNNHHSLDEFGLTQNAYKKALYSLYFLNIVKELDPNYLDHYNIKELSYIKLMEKNSSLLNKILDNCHYNFNFNKFIDLYVDESGLNNYFYNNYKYTYLFKNTELFLDFFSGWENYFSKNELQYIKYSSKHSFLKDEVIYKNTDLFFDENGITPKIVAYYFDSYEFDNLLKLVEDVDNTLINYLDEKKKKVIFSYKDVDDRVKSTYLDYIKNNYDDIDSNKINDIEKLITRLSLSNSSEIINFIGPVLSQLLKSENPFKKLDEIENIFIKNNIPTVGKIYLVFDILHSDFSMFDSYNMMSPTLSSKSSFGKRTVIFSDLIKASFGSNNRSVNAYLKNIEIGNKLYKMIISGQIKYDDLDELRKVELDKFCNYLYTLYSNSMKGKKDINKYELEGDVISDITNLVHLLSNDGSVDYNIADRVVSMFCHMAGIDTLEDAKNYIKGKINGADLRNREAATHDMAFEKGDFIKGIGDIKYLEIILQNGSVSKEFLGASADSDATPLDTDVSILLDSSGSVREKINSCIASAYGPIYFVLKNDDRFNITRTSEGVCNNVKDISKLEAFYTGHMDEGHYGIRTGFASSEINYIVMPMYDERVGIEIALNGFYIPIADMDGKIIFTPGDYDKLREKMNGLSHYGINEYKVDNSIFRKSDEITSIIEDMKKNTLETKKKADLIKNLIQYKLQDIGLELRDNIDLSNNSVVLFNTGSTGRYTNLPGDGDFDYTMQVDREIYSNEKKMNILRNQILKAFGTGLNPIIVNGDIRELRASVTDEYGNTYDVDIDITFTQKTDKAEYASDESVKDRFNSIATDEEREIVKANIILAKKFLKSIEAYKPARKLPEQGGMGGIGVENWILQNGGTLYSAAKSFMEVADKVGSFEDFCKHYSLPNFGYNHMALKKNFYPHDDYIQNMNSTGYEKMKKALRIYLNNYENNINNPVAETISELNYDNVKSFN